MTWYDDNGLAELPIWVAWTATKLKNKAVTASLLPVQYRWAPPDAPPNLRPRAFALSGAQAASRSGHQIGAYYTKGLVYGAAIAIGAELGPGKRLGGIEILEARTSRRMPDGTGIDVYAKEAQKVIQRCASIAVRHYFGVGAAVLFAYRTHDLPQLQTIERRPGFLLHLGGGCFWNFEHDGGLIDPWHTLRTLDPATVTAAIGGNVVDLAARRVAPEPLRLRRPVA
jgi:hypothetical protein